jgi:diguanylate cyclase (GGDEF)-like protein
MAISCFPGSLGRAARRLTGEVGGWQVWTLRIPARVFIAGVVALAAAMVVTATAATRVSLVDGGIFLALLGCGAVATEATRAIKEANGAVVRDLQTVWYLTIAVTLPPGYAFLAPMPLTAYRIWRVRRSFVYRRVFSNATISLAYGTASIVFHLAPAAIAGPRPLSGLHVLTWTGLAAGCGVLAWIINNGLLLGAIRLSDPQAQAWRALGGREGVVSDLIELSLAVSLALVVAINPVLMALALPSVVLYRRYLMNAQLVAQARIDPTTGVLNAATWRQEAELEVFRALRTRAPLALVMVDIDHFGSVAETAGGQAAGQVLREIAATLRESLHGAGQLGRVGSEEFAILLPGTGGDEARRVGERIRDHVAGEPIAIEDGNHAGFVFRLTVSIGIAVLDQGRRALAELISAADSALTVARATGRNRICVVGGDLDDHDTS